MYRLEQEFNRQGLKLSRQTMANWLLKASEKWLRPVYDLLHKQLCREPVLHADGYQGYHKLPENIRVVGCWAHARRKFDEALSTLPQEKRKDSPAAIGECDCSRLFKLEQALAALVPEERYEKRLKQEKPVLDALLSWANDMQARTAPKSALGRAIHYLLEQWPHLTR